MKIYGGSDFYDCGMAYGQDPSIMLVRKADDKIADFHSLAHDRFSIDINGFSCNEKLTHHHVAFASKVYHGVTVSSGYDSPGDTFWSADKLRTWLAGQNKTEMYLSGFWRSKDLPIDTYFEVEDVPQWLRDTMIEKRYAIIRQDHPRGYEPTTFINPPNLKLIHFARAIDPYTAFQELSMWVGGVLGGQSPEIVKITDNRTILEGHGFDNVISFRGPRI